MYDVCMMYRLAEVLFSICVGRHLHTYPTLPELLTSARQNLGLFQHHDGITGTVYNNTYIVLYIVLLIYYIYIGTVITLYY